MKAIEKDAAVVANKPPSLSLFNRAAPYNQSVRPYDMFMPRMYLCAGYLGDAIDLASSVEKKVRSVLKYFLYESTSISKKVELLRLNNEDNPSYLADPDVLSSMSHSTRSIGP